MKTKIFTAIVFAIMLCSSTFGQGGMRPDKPCQKPDFTEEQKAKIKEIRMAAYKELKPLQNQMGELKAKQKTLTTADKTDMNAINANIDEITKINNKIMKIKASTHQQIRALLTDEQKIWFDSKKMRHAGKKDGMKIHGRNHHSLKATEDTSGLNS